jgi:hypothetical protein
MPKHSRPVALIIWVLVATLSCSVWAEDLRFGFERIDYPVGKDGAQWGATHLTGINDKGNVIGYCEEKTDTAGNFVQTFGFAFIYSIRGKTFTELKPPLYNSNVDEVRPVAINDRNQILLFRNHTPQRHTYYYLYDIDQDTYTPVGVSGHLVTDKGVRTINFGSLKGLNDKGEILGTGGGGWVFGAPALGTPGSIAPPTTIGEFTAVANYPGGAREVTGINAQDQISGDCILRQSHAIRSAFVYRDGTFQSFVEPTAIGTFATAINNAGMIAGHYQPQKGIRNDLCRSFVYDGSKFTELPVTFGSNGHLPDYIFASGINNLGQVVGDFQQSMGNSGIGGFLATPISSAAVGPGNGDTRP